MTRGSGGCAEGKEDYRADGFCGHARPPGGFCPCRPAVIPRHFHGIERLFLKRVIENQQDFPAS
jgi:hypothetical protein